ncbi:hypothetical protein L2E82_23086 [Cichorium intybus]|uniref:Uncharacterized protein n=1 Tax=Cichorium intybus TaxID=13427 RepID=A0ACB9DZ14_CICIN|nr:hypothetical protein L2E82_23086 [Cichorium intybus]
MKLVDVDRTLIRYLRDNIPIETFKLVIDFENQESASLAEKWIRPVATKTCLKELVLTVRIYAASFTVPDEILLGENLTKLRVTVAGGKKYPVWMTTSQHPVINCVSLQELHLDGVCISEEVLHDILSSCRMLVKIVLLESCKGLKTIKVKNLPRLNELQIAFDAADSTALEVSDVPNLGVFSYDLHSLRLPLIPYNGHLISLGSSRVTQLMLGGMILDNVCLDTIKLGFPFLESLTIGMCSWMLESFHFTCASIKRLSLLSCPDTLIDVQVHAPNLLVFEFDGGTLPSLLFPASSLQVIRVSLLLHLRVDANFFLKMREALTLSRKCHLNITTRNYKPPLDIDIDDLRTRLPFPPARNVRQLSFQTSGDECMWERSPFFDAFFEICHPSNVYAMPDMMFKHNNHFCRLMLREVLEKNKTGTVCWPRYLKHAQISHAPLSEGPPLKWKTLTNSHRSFLDGSIPGVYLQFKLKWRR